MSAYTIRQGDYLAKIAVDHGFADWKPIWEHAKNEALRKKRDPNVLLPGDQLFIPEAERKALDGATEQKHTFSVARRALKLVLRFDDQHVGPVAGARCRLEIDGQAAAQLVTDGQGKVEREIAPGAETGLVVLEDPETPLREVVLPLRIGHLDPVEETSGQSARLNNLGYFAGPFADQTPDEAALSLRSAIEEFQCDQGLAVDGVCGARTQAALKKAHGS